MERRDERTLIQVWQEAMSDLNLAQEKAAEANRAEIGARNALIQAKKNEATAWETLCQYRDNQV